MDSPPRPPLTQQGAFPSECLHNEERPAPLPGAPQGAGFQQGLKQHRKWTDPGKVVSCCFYFNFFLLFQIACIWLALLVTYGANEAKVLTSTLCGSTKFPLSQEYRMHTWPWLTNTCCELFEGESQRTWMKRREQIWSTENELSVTHPFSKRADSVTLPNGSARHLALVCPPSRPQNCALNSFCFTRSSICLYPAVRLHNRSTSFLFSLVFVIKDKKKIHP